MRKPLYSLLLALGLAVTGNAAIAAGDYRNATAGAPSAGAMTVDLLVVRPVSLLASVIGLAVFIVQAPISAFHDDGLQTTGRKLVVEPLQFTFSRPIGDLD